MMYGLRESKDFLIDRGSLMLYRAFDGCLLVLLDFFLNHDYFERNMNFVEKIES